MDFPLVLVNWDDAWADSQELVSPEDAHLNHRVTKMVTVGWLLRDDEKGVSLFWERCVDAGDTSYRGRTFIPRAMITSIQPVVKSKGGRKKKHVTSEPLIIAGAQVLNNGNAERLLDTETE